MFGRLLKSRAAQQAAGALLAFYLAFSLRATCWRAEGEANLEPFIQGGPFIIAFWHQRLALAPIFWLRVRRRNPHFRLMALASRHRDGQLIGAVLRRFRMEVAHGSTDAGRDRGGAAAWRALLGQLRAERAVAITPDGPRGPAYSAAPGLALLAARAGVPILPAAAQTRWRLQLRSWDRMFLPLPFGRGGLIYLPAIQVARDGAAAALPAIEAALTEAAARADALCAR